MTPEISLLTTALAGGSQQAVGDAVASLIQLAPETARQIIRKSAGVPVEACRIQNK